MSQLLDELNAVEEVHVMTSLTGFAALLLYPVYVSRVTGLVCLTEQALQELLAWRQQSPGGLVWWRRWLRPLLARA